MKIKLLIITVLLLFITLSSEVMATEIQTIDEVEFALEEESSEKKIEKETLLLVNSFQLPSISMNAIRPSTAFLDNYLCRDNTYKPPIA